MPPLFYFLFFSSVPFSLKFRSSQGYFICLMNDNDPVLILSYKKNASAYSSEQNRQHFLGAVVHPI